MNFIPQMSPIYWMLICLFCYLNFMLMMILVNSFYTKISMKCKKIKYKIKKWSW